MDFGTPTGFQQIKFASFSTAFKLLIDGAYYARDVERSVWEFALSLHELEKCGLQTNDLRWLLRHGWILHGHDVSNFGDENRTIHPRQSCVFEPCSCFVLTPAGLRAMTEGAFDMPIIKSDPAHSFTASDFRLQPLLVPKWDAQRHELFFQDQIVKRFRWPAENQEAVLNAFEEEGWPSRIDDPIPQQSEMDPKRRLADTIKCLNRNHHSAILRFRGDGTGEGVLWDLICDEELKMGTADGKHST